MACTVDPKAGDNYLKFAGIFNQRFRCCNQIDEGLGDLVTHDVYENNTDIHLLPDKHGQVQILSKFKIHSNSLFTNKLRRL